MAMTKFILILQLFVLFLMSSCSNVLVYYPEKTTYNHPRDYDINYENFYMVTEDDVALHGWWLTPKEKEGIGTVIHFHSSEKNISFHLNDSRRLVEQGFNVLLFDYRGFGHSDGYPHKSGLKKDGVAAIDFLINREEVDINKIIIFAQAEGAPVALAALEAHGLKPACVVFDNPLYNYEKITEDTIGGLPLGKLVSWPASLLASLDDYSPSKSIRGIYGVPVLICHSENNPVISSEHSLSLYKNAFEPKRLYLTHDGGHLNILKNVQHCQEVVMFMQSCLTQVPATLTQQESPQE
jgi:uncharacterized protein